MPALELLYSICDFSATYGFSTIDINCINGGPSVDRGSGFLYDVSPGSGTGYTTRTEVIDTSVSSHPSFSVSSSSLISILKFVPTTKLMT